VPEVVQQLPALAFLAAGLGLGHRRWIRPRRHQLDRRGASLLLLLVLASMAGFVGSPFWWFDVRQSFPWDLPPLASRMLAAAGLSLTVGAVMTLERPTRQRLRLYLILLAAYLVPLAVTVLFHLDRFDYSAPITYGFFAAVAAVTVPSVVFLRRQPPIVVEEGVARGAVASAERSWFTGCATITGLWGLALLTTDDGPLDAVWVWPGDLLSSRLIAVMLLALAAGSVYSATRVDAVPVMLSVIVAYGAIVPLSSAANVLSGKPAKPAYIVVFAVLALGSVILLLRRTAKPATAPA